MTTDPLFKTIFESAPDAIIVINDRGKIIMSNQQATNLFGYEPAELMGMEVESLMPGEYAEKHKMHRARYAEQPNARAMGHHSQDLIGLRKDGSEFHAEISLSPVTIDDHLFVSAAVRDVTKKKEMLARVKSQQRLLELHNNRLMNFAYIVSHNLRSHSGNLGMMLSFLEQAGSETEKKELMAHLKALSDGLSSTVKQLSEVVSLTENENSGQEVINLRDYIEKTRQILKAQLSEIDGTIINNVSERINLLYNPMYMESILLNFLSNSIKYRHPERKLIVNINTSQQHDRVVLQIKDNGLGIDLTKHGQSLFGLHKTFHGNKDAHGIGLFITRNQVESQGGKIEVESEVGKGTIFKVFFLTTPET